MICSACGTENRAGRKFCSQCGTSLALACPSCGAANEPEERFCGECGAALAEAAAPPPAPREAAPEAPVAERRLVSVLFADLVGFTTLSESRDAEEVRELLSQYFETSRQLIARYGGVVEKFIGDAVMAVWGTPVAKEDDAERAVRAALELTDAVAAIGEQIGEPKLRARAGVLTGEAAVNIGAEGQGMVAGDLVNTASRIQSVAAPGAVLVGEATRRASEAAISYEDAGTHELKGKAESVQLWRADRVVAGTGGGQRVAGLEPPFVGRDRELRMIKDLFHATADEGKAQLVSVVGPAGIGKSRIAWEFFKYIDGLVADTRWHRGRCLAYGEGVTFWALAEMIRTNAGILEGEEPSTALPKLRVAVEHAVPEPEERRWVEPRLASLLGLEAGPTRDREDLFAAWRLFYERLADEMPTVMVFEDIQWADAALLDFIEYVLEWSRNHALFVVTLARPDLMDRRPDWGAGRRSFTSIHLEPLAGESMDELLTGLVPGLPEELSARVLDRAEGVPLYAVETVRMLLDKGLLAQEGSVYRPTGPVEELDVPETLHGLIAARLDGLMPEERRLAQDGAVLGKTFTKEALAAVSGLPPDELESLLGSLLRKEVMTVQADRLSPERGQYAFVGDLVRWVAYETLSKRERKARHLAAAAHLEEAFEEEDVVQVVASHCLQAYEAAPDAPDASEIKAKARDTLMRAGERAASLAASEEARRYFERAIDLADDPLTGAELHERAGEMAWTGGRAEEAVQHYQRAIELFESEGRTHPAARVSAAYAEVIWSEEGRIEEALDRMERAFEVLSKEEPDEDLATIAAQLGRFLFFSGRSELAAQRIEFALRLAEGFQLPEVLSQALNTKYLILNSQGHPEEASLLLGHALQVALDNDLGAAALRAYNNLCAFTAGMNRHEDELRAAEEGVELARRLGNRRWEVQLLACQINPMVSLGRWDEALTHVREVREAEEFGSAAALASETAAALPVYLHRGDLDLAREESARLAQWEQTEDVQTRVGSLVLRARLLRAEGRYEEALQLAEEALRIASDLGRITVQTDTILELFENAFALDDEVKLSELFEMAAGWRPGEIPPFLQAQLARFRARDAARRGQRDAVEPGLKQAAGMFRELQMPFWLAVALLELGEWLVSQGRGEEAKPLLDEAREVFERLNAAPWLERLERTGVGAARVS